MRYRDVKTFVMTSIVIFLALVALWFASFSLQRATPPDTGPDAPPPLSVLPSLSAVVRVRETADDQAVAEILSAAAQRADEEPQAPAKPEYSWYIVKSGDTLERIANDHYGSGALHHRIHQANFSQIPDPNRLSIGQKLMIPSRDGPIITIDEILAAEAARALPDRDVPAMAPEKRPVEYVVRKGDNLDNIAKRIYGSSRAWKVLYEANLAVIDDPSKIKPGTRLYIPRSLPDTEPARP